MRILYSDKAFRFFSPRTFLVGGKKLSDPVAFGIKPVGISVFLLVYQSELADLFLSLFKQLLLRFALVDLFGDFVLRFHSGEHHLTVQFGIADFVFEIAFDFSVGAGCLFVL